MGKRGPDGQYRLPKVSARVADAGRPCLCGSGNYCHQHRAYNLPATSKSAAIMRLYESRVRIPPSAGRGFHQSE